MNNSDQAEITKFNAHADSWWDIDGPYKTLHQINPLRLNFIEQYCELSNKRVLDVGCGGGILSESMAAKGAMVTGIDLAEDCLTVAKNHSISSAITVRYDCINVEELAAVQPASFDIITCMEMLEHVPDPQAIIHACAQLVNPNGLIFLSTLNRNLRSFIQGIVGAEYLLRLLPRGTHQYSRFIKPAELSTWARAANLNLQAIIGIQYNPITQTFKLSPNCSVNYLVCYRKIG